MSKLYRSLLCSGLVAAGVAACGDDVTVTPPPPPPAATVHSVSVAPNPGNIAPGGTLQMVVSVNADAGVATTVAWTSSNAAVVSVSGTGLATAVAAAVPGTTVAITACSTVVTGVCGSASVTVSAVQTPTVTSVTVTPPSAGLVVGQTITPTAAVVGTNNPAQTVTWSLATAGNIISINAASGLITALANGTAVAKACSTVNTAVCGSIAVTVTTPSPASVQITNVTYVPTILVPDGEDNMVPSCIQGPGPSVPVVLTNVRCQIEVAVQVNSGDQTLSRVDVLIDGQVMASQSFSTTPSGAELSPTSTDITLSFNTNQVRRNNGFLVPVVTNGNGAITAQLFVVGASTPLASNAIPVVLNNDDALVALGSTGAISGVTITPESQTPSVTDDDGNVWFTGNSTIAGPQYVSFSTKVPTSLAFEGSVCGTSTSIVTGNAASGIGLSGVWDCANSEGENTLVDFDAPDFDPPLNGPDGTALTPPQLFSNIGGGFNVAGDTRWNLITPAVPEQTFASLFIDNKAPVVSLAGTVAYNANYDQFWVNAAYNFLNNLGATDGGPIVGGTSIASLNARLFNVTCGSVDLPNPHGLAETLTSSGFDAYRICGAATDFIGNVGLSGASNKFGVDVVVPLVRLNFATPPGVNPVPPYVVPNVSATPNTSKYPTLASIINMPWGLESQDTRSGFNQTVVVSFPDAASQSLIRLWPGAVSNTGDSACSLSDQLILVLSDSWKRTFTPAPGQDQLDCGAGVGYFTYNGNSNDRAGNFSATITRNLAYDPGTPNMTGIGFAQTFYTPGAPGSFGFSGNDDLSIITGSIGFNYSGLLAPAVGIIYPEGSIGNLGTPFPSTKAGLTAVLNGAILTVPTMLFRIDESCAFNANPYTTCDVGTNGVGSKPTSAASYAENLNGGGTLTNQQRLPNAVLANIADIVGRESLTGASGAMLSTQFNPSTGIAAPWGAAGCGPISSTCADIANWTANNGVTATSTITAIQQTQTSNGLAAFTAASLWRLNTTTNQYVFCNNLSVPSSPSLDNGTFRQYFYQVAVASIPTACTSLTGPYKAMGTIGGAGLFTAGF
jgi:hypothetical protein